MREKKTEGQTFLEGAIVLTVATFVVKVIGALFKIPLANILGGVGMSYFVSAYDIFTPLYSFTVTGLGIALSRMVSEQVSQRAWGNVEAVLNAARHIFWTLGLVGMLLLAAVAPNFVQIINNPGALFSVYAIAPAILFSCISSIYRGYYQGLSNMVPTAASQVLEAGVKLIAGTALSYGVTLALRKQYDTTGQLFGRVFATAEQADLSIFQYSAAAAVLGVTLSTFAGAAYISLRHRHRAATATCVSQQLTSREESALGRQLIFIAIPISLSTLVVNLSALIDLVSVMNCLQIAIYQDVGIIFSMYQGLIPQEVTSAILPEYLYGSYSGLAFSIFNLIPSLTAAIGISALPSVTRFWAVRDREQLEETISSVLRISLMAALPAGLGILVLSGPILNLLYPARAMEAAIIAPVLRIMGISAILVAAATPINSILQAIGRERFPLVVLTIGAVMKLCTNLVLISRPEVNIQGVPYGTLLCYSFIVLVSTGAMVYFSHLRLSIWKILVKPLFCAIVSALAAYASYYLLFASMSRTVCTIAAIVLAGAVYMAMILLTRTITTSDLKMLPIDEKIVKTLANLGVIG